MQHLKSNSYPRLAAILVGLFIAVGLLVWTPQTAVAQNLITVTLDKSYTVSVYGKKGDPSLVVFWKVINHKGRAYVCGAYTGRHFLADKFVERGKIRGPKGERIMGQLIHFRGPKDFLRQSTIERKRPQRGMYGQKITCRRSWLKWDDTWTDTSFKLILPNRVSYRREI